MDLGGLGRCGMMFARTKNCNKNLKLPFLILRTLKKKGKGKIEKLTVVLV